MDRLNEMIQAQYEFQQKLGHDYPTMSIEKRVKYVKDMILACTAELHEALDETGWKPWATSRHINEEAAFNELRDAWQFLTNAMFAITASEPNHVADRLYDALFDKLVVNHRRVDNGYDGVSGKCPNCRRDLAEIILREVRAQSLPRIDLHCVCGRYIGSKPI